MDFPNDVDYVIVGTGLAESMIAASLTITGSSVLHLDREEYYGGPMTSFRFPELICVLEKWKTLPQTVDTSPPTDRVELNLSALSRPFVRNCSFSYTIPEDTPEQEQPPPPVLEEPECPPNVYNSADLVSANEEVNCLPPGVTSSFSDLTPTATTATSFSTEFSSATSTLLATSSITWTRKRLLDVLRRADFDITSKVIFADSPIVHAMVRSDVTRYLEFRSINRLLAYENSDANARPPSSTPTSQGPPTSISSSRLVKIPVSRGEVFQTRMLSLSQKRLLVSFLEWCGSLATNVSASDDAPSVATRRPPQIDFSLLEQEDAAYLDLPLVDYLQDKRHLDIFLSRITVNCLALARPTITLRQALPRFNRLLSSMNRFGPFPMLWPIFGCGELPQSFCRMCAVFSGTYCLGRTITAVRPVEAAADIQSRRYRVSLTTGEEVSASCVLIGADQAPVSWLLPQIRRWIARAILVTDSSVFPADHRPYDITMVPVALECQDEEAIEPAFILETPVEKQGGRADLYITHMTLACAECINPETTFSSLIENLYSKDSSDEKESSAEGGTSKPRILWNCFFCIPDLSAVGRSLPTDVYRVESEAVFVVPGIDSSIVMDGCVAQAEQIFHQAFPLAQHSSPNDNIFAPVSTDGESPESSATNRGAGSTLVSLDANWDGVFPPRPPRPEDLVVIEGEIGAVGSIAAVGSEDWGVSNTITPVSARPNLLPSGHGDWSVAAVDNTGESEFTTAVDPNF